MTPATDRASGDAALWRQAAAGQHEAFSVLFDRHSEVVYNYLFRRTADWSAAEDLTAAVFLQVWRPLPAMNSGIHRRPLGRPVRWIRQFSREIGYGLPHPSRGWAGWRSMDSAIHRIQLSLVGWIRPVVQLVGEPAARTRRQA